MKKSKRKWSEFAEKKLFWVLLIASAFSVLLYMWMYRDKLAEVYNHEQMGHIYSESQYVKGPKATVTIGDDGLFSVAGYYLFFQGGDPSQIHFESPPLGEYLIGLSIWLTGTVFFISVVYAILILILTYFLSFILWQSKLLSSLAVLLLAQDHLFLQHIRSVLLDLPQTLFITSSLLFLTIAIKKNKKWFYFLSSFFLGCATSTKFFPGTIFFIFVFMFWVGREDKKNLILYLISLLLVPLVYLLSYTAYFHYHPSLIEFVRFQLWVITWRLGNPRVLGNIFLTMLTGRYLSWWEPESWQVNVEWTPISTIIYILAMVSPLIARNLRFLIYIYALLILFILYLALGTTGVAKYLLLMYPVIVILASATIIKLLFPMQLQKGI